ncbi:MAG: phospho-sugar mutase [Ruminococcaceae bacterium]|nr:phospho-sugar mutase [Oscillospiraceae bacterium]
MSNYKTEFKKWVESPYLDEESRKELLAIEGDETEKELRFLGYLEFGTGGLRGTMGAGINKMNVYTVAHATQGMAEMIKLEGGNASERGVVIACDSRNNSTLFAEVAASVLSANDIKAYIFDGVRPTPELSFAIRHLGCIAGINITASHNPKEYNGYKAYWEDGAQLPPQHASVVSAKTKEIDIFTGVKKDNFDEAVKAGKIIVIGEEVDRVYMQNVLAQRVKLDAVKNVADDFAVVYTPLHGAGYKLVPEALAACGVTKLYTVKEQMVLDGDFPTVKKPNPELPDAFTLGIKLANEVGSDIIVATDPDSDRMGAMTRSADGSFVTITGNQMAALLLDYIFTALKEGEGIPADAYAVKTIVSTELAAAICKANGVKLYNVLTGFKFIGEVIKNHEAEGHGTFMLGFEESYGYLKGTYARDKDAVCAAMLAVEMAAYYKAKNMTLYDALLGLYEKYGYYGEKSMDVYMEGLDGIERRTRTMKALRENAPKAICGYAVSFVGDYLAETITYADGKVEGTGLPKSDVLYYGLENGDVAVVRPSGTEPKIKIYYLANDKSAEALAAKLEKYASETDKLVK